MQLTRDILFDKPTHALGVTQILNWGILYYSPALLSKPIAKDLGVDVAYIYAAYSLTLIVSGFFAAPVGKLLDAKGGRIVMSLGTIFASLTLLFWASASSLTHYVVSSIFLGLAMRFTLYEAAFASIVEMKGLKARPFITIVTLHGALASSILWGITYWLELKYGWRMTLILFAISLLVISLPLNWFYIPSQKITSKLIEESDETALISPEKRQKALILFAFSLTLSSVVFASLSIHLITFLEGLGLTLAAAVAIASTKGVAQLLGRLGELLWGQKIHPILIAIFANGVLFISFLFLFNITTFMALTFCFFYGIGQGLLTIVRGSLPIVLFGKKGYGALTGKIVTPSLILTAFMPFLFGWFIERYGEIYGLIALMVFSALSFLNMILLKRSL